MSLRGTKLENQKNDTQEADLRAAYQAIHKVMNPDDPADPMRIAHDHCLRELVALKDDNMETENACM